MEVGEAVDYIPIATLSPSEWLLHYDWQRQEPFNVSLIVRDKVTNETVSTDHSFWRERRAEGDSNRGPSAYQPNALPLGQTGSQSLCPTGGVSVLCIYLHARWEFLRSLLLCLCDVFWALINSLVSWFSASLCFRWKQKTDPTFERGQNWLLLEHSVPFQITHLHHSAIVLHLHSRTVKITNQTVVQNKENVLTKRSRSKCIKGSKELYLLGHNTSWIFGVILFIKLQNET